MTCGLGTLVGIFGGMVSSKRTAAGSPIAIPMETIAQLFKIIWAPRETLREVARRPSVVAPLVLLTLFAGLETAIVFSTLDPGELRLQEFKRGGYADKISDSDKIIHAQAARNNRGFAVTVASIRALITVLAVAGVFFLFFGIGRGVSFKSFLAVTAFAFIPGIFHSIASVAVVMTSAPNPNQTTLLLAGSVSPVRFLNPESVSGLTYLTLSTLDVVSVWILALLIIGYGFVLRDRVGLIPRVLVIGSVYCLASAAFVGSLLFFGVVPR